MRFADIHPEAYTCGHQDAKAFKQSGDPNKAAEFLYKIAVSESLPQIITIGQDCSDASLNHYKQIIQAIESYYDDSCRTVFED